MSLDPREFRNALGRFATGVCVITTEPAGGKPFGMTINSFSSVSLEPPLVLWSLQKNSECFAAFENTKQFAVNILSADQQAISNQFAKKGEHDLPEGSYSHGESGCVVLNDVITSFECEVDAVHEGGDHVIIVGRVLAMNNQADPRDPLLFFSGKYRELKALA